ncbi:hypothetical protein TNCV_1308111 [Trichonephila clavipes]|nr:hypothetical protein TNCV_1308111 [Trichonephila clavipes]
MRILQMSWSSSDTSSLVVGNLLELELIDGNNCFSTLFNSKSNESGTTANVPGDVQWDGAVDAMPRSLDRSSIRTH